MISSHKINDSLLAFIGLFIIIRAVFSQAQSSFSFEGTLTYVKILEDKTRQYFQLASGQVSTLTVAPEEYSSTSTAGTFVAIISPVGALSVYRLADQQKVYQLNDADYSPGLYWLNDTELALKRHTEHDTALNVLTGEIYPLTLTNETETNLLAQIDRLPDKVPAENAVLSPDQTLVVYSQCLNQAYSADQTFCTEENQVVLYSLAQRQIVEVLPHVAMESLYHNDPPHAVPNIIYWSPSGHYLLYFTYDREDFIRLYDTHTHQYLMANALSSANPDLWNGFKWSNDESRIGFWSVPESSDMNFPPQKFAFFDVIDRLTHVYDSAFVLGGISYLWSPDQRAIVLLTRDQELIILNLVDGTTSLLDQAVYAINSWTE